MVRWTTTSPEEEPSCVQSNVPHCRPWCAFLTAITAAASLAEHEKSVNAVASSWTTLALKGKDSEANTGKSQPSTCAAVTDGNARRSKVPPAQEEGKHRGGQAAQVGDLPLSNSGG